MKKSVSLSILCLALMISAFSCAEETATDNFAIVLDAVKSNGKHPNIRVYVFFNSEKEAKSYCFAVPGVNTMDEPPVEWTADDIERHYSFTMDTYTMVFVSFKTKEGGHFHEAVGGFRVQDG